MRRAHRAQRAQALQRGERPPVLRRRRTRRQEGASEAAPSADRASAVGASQTPAQGGGARHDQGQGTSKPSPSAAAAAEHALARVRWRRVQHRVQAGAEGAVEEEAGGAVGCIMGNPGRALRMVDVRRAVAKIRSREEERLRRGGAPGGVRRRASAGPREDASLRLTRLRAMRQSAEGGTRPGGRHRGEPLSAAGPAAQAALEEVERLSRKVAEGEGTRSSGGGRDALRGVTALVEALLARAQAWGQLGRGREAWNDVEHALTLAPRNVTVLSRWGTWSAAGRGLW